MKEGTILNIFQERKALLTGHFKLSSGLHSGQYLQCALVLQDPKYAERICGELASRFKGDNVNVVIGPALGGIVLSYEVARALGSRSIFAEREDGKMKLRRGFSIDKDNRVLVVEDVLTTGLSTKEVIGIVKELGGHLVGVGVLVDRSGGIDFGVKLTSLLKMDIPTFKPEACPLCKESIPLIKPGSRR